MVKPTPEEDPTEAHSITADACPCCGRVHIHLYDKNGDSIGFANMAADEWLDMLEPVDEQLQKILDEERQDEAEQEAQEHKH